MNTAQIDKWNEQFGKSSAEEVLAFFLNEFKGEIALSSSLGAEDQVLTHLVASIDKALKAAVPTFLSTAGPTTKGPMPTASSLSFTSALSVAMA